MAALRPRPAGIVAPASSTLGASRLTSWSPRTRSILPLGRHSTTPVKVQAGKMASRLRHSHAIRAHKGAADQPVGPDPEDEYAAAKFKKFVEKLKKACKRRPDMPFGTEIDKIDKYGWSEMDCCKTSILHLEARALSLEVCAIARDAIDLASRIIDYAGLRPGMPGAISLHTIKQAVTTYVGIFLNIVDDTHQMKATMDTIVSFLDALGGVAAISHILLQDALANLNYNEYSSSNNSPADCDVDRARIDRVRHEFEQELNNLKHKFRTAPPYHAYKILRPTLVDAIILTRSYVIVMTVNLKRALGQVQGGDARAPDDGRGPEASDTGSDSVSGK